MVGRFILYFSLFFTPAFTTVDITLPQFQYVANHLSSDECVLLIQELFRIDSDIPENLSCLELLLFWNSSPEEGLGETHHLVCSYLEKMKRTDLSIWLSKSVFEQLQLSHKKSVQTVDEVIITDQAMNNDNEDASDDGMNIDNEWSVLDTVGYVIMLICLLLSVVLCASVFIPRNKAGRDEFNTRFLSQNKKYSYKYISRGTEKSFGETI